MKSCRYSKNIIDYIEGLMPLNERADFESHLKICSDCQKEVNEIKKLYEILNKDEVPELNGIFFEDIRMRISKKEIYYKLPLWKIFGILVPMLTVFILILLNLKTEQMVEFSIPVSELLDDEYLNSLLLDKIIDKKIITNFEILEEYLTPTVEQDLDEMNKDELKVFMEVLSQRYNVTT
ncbi:MAG: zf-HC2 domain-containing protein [candidate division WOR-3 bacterium]